MKTSKIIKLLKHNGWKIYGLNCPESLFVTIQNKNDAYIFGKFCDYKAWNTNKDQDLVYNLIANERAYYSSFNINRKEN